MLLAPALALTEGGLCGCPKPLSLAAGAGRRRRRPCLLTAHHITLLLSIDAVSALAAAPTTRGRLEGEVKEVVVQGRRSVHLISAAAVRRCQPTCGDLQLLGDAPMHDRALLVEDLGHE